MEVDEPDHVVASARQDFAIATLQRRTRNDAPPAVRVQVVNPSRDRLQPRQAVGIGQRNTVFQTPAEFLGEQSSDRRLARSRYAHDNERRDAGHLALKEQRLRAVHAASPAAARSTRNVRSPRGRNRAAGTSTDRARTALSMSRLPAPEIRNAV